MAVYSHIKLFQCKNITFLFGVCVFQEHQLMFYECSAASGHNVFESMVSFVRWGMCLDFPAVLSLMGSLPAFLTPNTGMSLSPWCPCPNVRENSGQHVLGWALSTALTRLLNNQHCKEMNETLFGMLLLSSWLDWNKFCLWFDLGWCF